MATTGIYRIQSIIKTEKFYIGSAIDVSARQARHLSELRKGKHCNRHMQYHFNKYGEDDFVFILLEECTHIQLLKREQWWIDETLPTFNVCMCSRNRYGVTATFATREKIKKSW